MKKIFREYDIRGIFQKEVTSDSVKAIGVALGEVFRQKKIKKVSVGYDARLSCKVIKEWLFSGLNKMGVEIYDIGLLPTPVGYYSVFSEVFDANIMITGSHNPKDYNGFKITIDKESFFGTELYKLGDRVCEILQDKMEIEDDFRASSYDVKSRYVDFFRKNFTHLKNCDIKMVADCANGAMGAVLRDICDALCFKNVDILYEKPDGNFPNHHPDPTVRENLKDLQLRLKELGAKIGFGFDGDGDRVVVVTPKGVINCDYLAYLFALNITNPKVVGDVKCSINMYNQIDKFGTTYMAKTGHSNIKKAIQELGANFGAELSGHLFFADRYFGFDDGLYAMIRAVELLVSGFDFDEILSSLPTLFSTDEIKIESCDETKFRVIEELKKVLEKDGLKFEKIEKLITIDGVRVNFKDGWALVRASNTTPTLVTRYEGASKDFIDRARSKFEELIKKIEYRLEREKR